jgi:hypothetical protein
MKKLNYIKEHKYSYNTIVAKKKYRAITQLTWG